MGLNDGLTSAINTATGLMSNPLVAAAGGAVAGGAVVGTAFALSSASKTKRRKTSKSTKKRKSGKTKRKIKYARTARKRKDTSHKRIRMTKNGQPYVIMASGKARFISKSSARNSRRRKGGRY